MVTVRPSTTARALPVVRTTIVLRACAAGTGAHKSTSVTTPHNAFRDKTLSLCTISQHLQHKYSIHAYFRRPSLSPCSISPLVRTFLLRLSPSTRRRIAAHARFELYRGSLRDIMHI